MKGYSFCCSVELIITVAEAYYGCMEKLPTKAGTHPPLKSPGMERNRGKREEKRKRKKVP